jgi:predicted RNA binding protein YcfA (HicA-like mRNA interferase family)
MLDSLGSTQESIMASLRSARWSDARWAASRRASTAAPDAGQQCAAGAYNYTGQRQYRRAHRNSAHTDDDADNDMPPPVLACVHGLVEIGPLSGVQKRLTLCRWRCRPVTPWPPAAQFLWGKWQLDPEIDRTLTKDVRVERITGKHHVTQHPDGRAVTVPVHAGRDMPKATMRNIQPVIGMTPDELRALL